MRSRTATFFEATVRYDRQTEDSTIKKVSELYVLTVLSFSEAEARIIKEITPFVSGDFDVTKLAIAPYREVFFTDSATDDRWFRAKLYFVAIDEKTAKEKRTAMNYLVQAADIESARKNIEQLMPSTAIDYEISSIAETKVLDVFE